MSAQLARYLVGNPALLALEPSALLAQLAAISFQPVAAKVQIHSTDIVNRLDDADAVQIFALLKDIVSGALRIPNDDGTLLMKVTVVASALDGAGVNIAEPKVLPSLQQLKLATSGIVPGWPTIDGSVWDTIISWGWTPSAASAFATATIDDVTASIGIASDVISINVLLPILAANTNDAMGQISLLAEQRIEGAAAQIPTLQFPIVGGKP